MRWAAATFVVLFTSAMGYISYEAWYHFLGGGVWGKTVGIVSSLLMAVVVYKVIDNASKEPLDRGEKSE
jgi:hypothetical protein